MWHLPKGWHHRPTLPTAAPDRQRTAHRDCSRMQEGIGVLQSLVTTCTWGWQQACFSHQGSSLRRTPIHTAAAAMKIRSLRLLHAHHMGRVRAATSCRRLKHLAQKSLQEQPPGHASASLPHNHSNATRARARANCFAVLLR